MSDAQPKHPVTELFRFARVTATPVIDIEQRARTRGLPGQADARQTWARTFLKSERVKVDLSELAFPFTEYLTPETSISDAIPSRASLKNPKAFASAAVERDPRYQEDRARLQDMLLALALSGNTADRAQQDDVARLVQFVEAFPRIAESPHQRPYAPVVSRRVAKVATPPRPAGLTPKEEPASDTTAAEFATGWSPQRDGNFSQLIDQPEESGTGLYIACPKFVYSFGQTLGRC